MSYNYLSRTSCYSPMSIPRPNGRGSTDRITVPCNKCAACINRSRRAWAFRLAQELKTAETAFFVTLTYATDNLPIDEYCNPCVSKRDCQLFLKRLRRSLPNRKIRYYLVSEYGTSGLRPHYHAIIFNLPNSTNTIDKLNDAWQQGFVHVGSVTTKSINYVTKYVFKKTKVPQGFTPCFSLKSSRPGIGADYIAKRGQWHTSNAAYYAIADGGSKISLPRYFRDRIFDRESRENHAHDSQFELLNSETESLEDYLSRNKDKTATDFYRYKLDLINDLIRNTNNSLNDKL